jgi:serine/threonine protein kinase
VVHRDIKPENVLIGEKLDAKIIDFSIATTKMDRLLAFFGQKTAGSPSYMAPEQIQNRKTDHRADIYALGILTFEVLAGRLPFNGRSMQELFEKHCKEAAPGLRKVNPEVPPDISDVVAAMLQKDPERRPSDLREQIYIIGKNELAASKES